MKRALLALALLASGCGNPHPSGDARAARDTIRANAAHAVAICAEAKLSKHVDRNFNLTDCAAALYEIHAETGDWEDDDK